MTKLCICPRRKCGALATAATIREITSDVTEGFFTLNELKVKLIKRFSYRTVQFNEFGGGVKSKNWMNMIAAVINQPTKGALLNMLENTNAEYHERIKNA